MTRDFAHTIVMRHQKENLRKCSLRGFGLRDDFTMLTYPHEALPDVSGRVFLTIDAPPLSVADAGRGLLVLDATWRHALKMHAVLRAQLETATPRSIPNGFVTAYPRRQTECPDPQRGLASVEAIYIAYHITGRDTRGLLDRYLWADQFLQLNAEALKRSPAARG